MEVGLCSVFFDISDGMYEGPESQFRPSFLWRVQYFVVELGIAFIAPNVRGSTGYGKTYVKLDDGYLREDSVKDIGALLDWIANQPGTLSQQHIFAHFTQSSIAMLCLLMVVLTVDTW
jgi:hypothetical protein